MSYCNKMKYGTEPKTSFQIRRKCGKCGKKQIFINTCRFRVNANGNKVDVWLIYQCSKCKHTCNLTIYERRKPGKIPADEYKRFLENDEELALFYGINKEFFLRNKAEIF